MIIQNKMKIYPQNKRDWYGVVGWFIVSLLINLLALIPMVYREYYQYKRYNIEFEWEDVIRYSIVILVGSITAFSTAYSTITF